jgi:NTF2 fold immunity protein
MKKSTDIEKNIIQIAKEYAIKMNDIENRILELKENNSDNKIDYFEEYKKQYNPVFQHYSTNKKRVYRGQANSYGKPTKYDGINEETNGQISFKSSSKAEVYFKTNNVFKAEYLFVLLKESDVWKIDNVKFKWYNNEKWKSNIM